MKLELSVVEIMFLYDLVEDERKSAEKCAAICSGKIVHEYYRNRLKMCDSILQKIREVAQG